MGLLLIHCIYYKWSQKMTFMGLCKPDKSHVCLTSKNMVN